MKYIARYLSSLTALVPLLSPALCAAYQAALNGTTSMTGGRQVAQSGNRVPRPFYLLKW